MSCVVLSHQNYADIHDIYQANLLKTPSLPHWHEQDWMDLLIQDYYHAIAIISPSTPKPYGFMIYQSVDITYELIMIAIHPDHHHQGYGKQLLNYLKNQCQSIILEVHAANLPAKQFYTLNGFNQIAVRKHYYTQDNGDAEIYQWIHSDFDQEIKP